MWALCRRRASHTAEKSHRDVIERLMKKMLDFLDNALVEKKKLFSTSHVLRAVGCKFFLRKLNMYKHQHRTDLQV